VNTFQAIGSIPHEIFESALPRLSLHTGLTLPLRRTRIVYEPQNTPAHSPSQQTACKQQVVPFGVDMRLLSSQSHQIQQSPATRAAFILCVMRRYKHKQDVASAMHLDPSGCFLCWLASAAASSGPPFASTGTRKLEMGLFYLVWFSQYLATTKEVLRMLIK
jgi:hypothetical protein